MSGKNDDQSALNPQNPAQIATNQEQPAIFDNLDSDQANTGTEVSSIRLLAEDPLETSAESPALLRNFPASDAVPNDPLILQLGIYSQLSSAELIQEKLTPLGLYPVIDKRHGENGIRYIVMLGPYFEPKEKEQVVSTLDREHIAYYPKSQGSL
jgi:cell division protein FtsN